MNTEPPPPPLSNAEAVQILTDGRLLASLTPRQKDAVLRAVHLVSRRSAQKERNERSRRARKEAIAPTPAPLSPDAPPCVHAPETNPATETEAARAYREGGNEMTNLELVAAELEAAKKKHPHFVDSLLPPRERYSPEWYDDALDMSRARLADAVKMKRCYLHQIIQCEAYEAFAAYAHDDLAHAKQELAQCAAVCIRAMEFIDDKINKETNE